MHDIINRTIYKVRDEYLERRGYNMAEQRERTLPIGNDDFRKVREIGAYYVDKTMMIRDFLKMKDEVALIARPRRFGKTLSAT